MRVLVVEDDAKIASFVVNGLKQNGFAVDLARDGEAALDLALVVTYAAAVLDLNLPKLDGLSLLRQLRQKKDRHPRAHPQRPRDGGRPRARPAIRRRRLFQLNPSPSRNSSPACRLSSAVPVSATDAPGHLATADLRMDLFKREVTRGAATIDLQPREFSLLELLLRHAGPGR